MTAKAATVEPPLSSPTEISDGNHHHRKIVSGSSLQERWDGLVDGRSTDGETRKTRSPGCSQTTTESFTSLTLSPT